MNSRRDFLKSLVLVSALFPLMSDAKKLLVKNALLVGGDNNDLVIYNFNTNKTTVHDIGFRGHSYLQNPLNKNHILIPQKGGANWCVFDIKSKKRIKKYGDEFSIFYGHIAFSEDQKTFYVPKKFKKAAYIDVYDSRTYRLIETMPLEVVFLHEVRMIEGTNTLIMACNGFFGDKGVPEGDGVVVFDLTTKKIIKKINLNSEGFFPTHLLKIKGDNYIVSTEVPRGSESYLGVASDEKGKRVFKGGLYHVNIGDNSFSKKLVFPEVLEKELKDNISNFIYDSKRNIVYFENIEGRRIFVLDADKFEYVKDYNIKTHGLFQYEDKLYVSSEDKVEVEEIKNSYDLCKKYLTNTHFSIIEINA